MFFKINALKNFPNFTAKPLCWSLFFIKLQACIYTKETLTQAFSCEIYEMFKNIFFYKTPTVAASVKA